MTETLSVLPLDGIGLIALACVVSAMTALGIGIEPARVLARDFPLRPLVVALAIALVLVPLAALGLARLFGLQSGALVGLVLMGISPGAPMALRKSGQAGADGDFALVLQVAVGVLAIGAVPGWLVFLHEVYGRQAEISLGVLARQVFLVQLMPLACGALLRKLLPKAARRLVRPLMLLSGVLMLAVAVLLVALLWRPLSALPTAAFGASAALTATALLLAYAGCGPSVRGRMSAGVICALRNPGLALLVASANGLPPEAKIMVLAHVLVTATVLGVYLALLRRSDGYRREVAEGAQHTAD